MHGGLPVSDKTGKSPGRLWTFALEWLVTVYATAIVLGSIVLFMMSTTSEQVRELIAEQNASGLKLWSNLEYYRDHHRDPQPSDASLPPGLFDELVEFSRRNGEIIKTVHRLRIENVFSQGSSWEVTQQYINHVGAVDGSHVQFDHYGVDPHTDTTSVVQQGMYQIELYQAIRDYAQDLCNYAKWFLGAITTYLLPVAYALLGAFLYAFRSFARRAPEQETASLLDRNSRFLMAAIAGIAISLFSSLIPQSMPLSPLALAFLVGYSIEEFTSRLDELVRRLTRKP